MTKIEELEAQLVKVQEELEELKRQQPAKATPWQLTEDLEEGYMVSVELNGEVSESVRSYENDLNAFDSEEVAKGFANAFRVMILLRQCEGAGELDQDGDGWIFDSDGDTDRFGNSSCFTLCPPFPSEALACAAANSVGIENIKNAYKFLSNIKD